ncbi:MAG: hypothetical protein Q9201_007719 [Fulgogasparrea decipioides]
MRDKICIIIVLLFSLVIGGYQSSAPRALESPGIPSKSITTAVPRRAPTDIQDPPPSLSHHPDNYRLNSPLRSLIGKARSVVDETWSKIRRHDTSSLVISSAWKVPVNLCLQLVEESYQGIVDYFNRLSRYVKAAKEYEETLQRKRKPPMFPSSIAIIPSRDAVIGIITTRAELRPEDIPYPAFIGEWAVRKTVQ